MVSCREENEAGLCNTEGLGGRATSLDGVVKEGFLEDAPFELKREKKRSRKSLTKL